MNRRPLITRERLDATVVDIEFLLIAVVQGLALTTLAVESEAGLGGGPWYYWPYVIAAFLLVLNFWSQALIHSISFISWPFDIVHTLLYFLASFIEVTAFAQITHPARWFIFIFAFFAVSFLLYAWDLRMIRQKRQEFAETSARRALYSHILGRQRFELAYLLPAAIAFHGLLVVVLWSRPDLILDGNRHVYLASLQAVIGLGYLVTAVRSFSRRSALINACMEDEPTPVA
jgi:hypothetical protein